MRPLVRWVILLVLASSVVFGEAAGDMVEAARNLGKASVGGGERPPAARPPSPLPSPSDAVDWVIADVRGLDPIARRFTRYVFVPDPGPDIESVRTTSLALAYAANRSAGVTRPLILRGGKLLRVDLRWYVRDDNPDKGDLKELLDAWEELQFDPSFALLLPVEDLENAVNFGVEVPRRVKTVTKRVPGRGKFSKTRVTTEEVEQKADLVRVNQPALNRRLVFLQTLLETFAPIVDHHYFKARVLHTVKHAKADDETFKTIFGGLYYEFAGVKKAKAVLGVNTKATDLDLFFENLGIGNIKGGLNADQLFDKLVSDRAVAMWRSRVTDKPRDVLWFNTPSSGEPASGGAITGDLEEASIRLKDRGIANLLKPKRDAREAIFPKADGFDLFALFDGKGALQDQAPDKVVRDNTVPSPATNILEGAYSCIVCHGTQGRDGWQDLVNDAARKFRRLDVYGDQGDKNLRGFLVLFDAKTVNRLAAKYKGDLKGHVALQRDRVASVTLRATGPWKASADQSDVCRLAAQRLKDERTYYWWESVDARRALRELGLDTDPKESVGWFNKLVAPNPAGRVGNVFLEDPRIGYLAEGVAIPRADWSLVQGFVAERLARNPLWVKMREVKKSGKRGVYGR